MIFLNCQRSSGSFAKHVRPDLGDLVRTGQRAGQDRGGQGLLQTGARFFSGDQVDLRADGRKDEDRLITRPCSLMHSGYGVAGVR